MDAQRFDNLARSLAARFSRRGALRRGGAAAAAGVLAGAGLSSVPIARAQDADDSGDNTDPVYTVIRRYTLDGPTRAVRDALEGSYLKDACRARGFIAYFAVEDEDGDFVTVAVFQSQDDFEQFADDEAQWIAQNLSDLLPAPQEAISGQAYIHAGSPQAFRGTCPNDPSPQPTAAPGQPTNTPAPAPTAAPTATPSCTGENCVCSTGTRRPCDRPLVCCPTTDIPGGPGICQTRDECFPSDCAENAAACPQTCGADDACPGCCSGYCSDNDQCADAPSPPCTSEGCDCRSGTFDDCDDDLVCCAQSMGGGDMDGRPGLCLTPAECDTPCTTENCACNGGVQGNCDVGLVCCQEEPSIPGGPGTCVAEAACQPAACTSQGCDCNGGVQGNCDDGLVCCQDGQSIPGGAGTCEPEADCAPAPCTGQDCECNGGVLGACDAGLVCCQDGAPIPGGAGTCQPEAECAPAPCTGEGCACNGGVQGNCDAGLVCCQDGVAIPGGVGTCTAEASCSPPPCTGEGCDCNGGVQGACDDGLICCQTDPSVPGGPGTCQAADACGPPPCTDNGGGCDSTCNWGDTCPGCCSGYCNDTGQCDNAPPVVCTNAGCACNTGVEGACDDGLTCCSTSGDPGSTGACQASC